ncbi:Transcription repressor OFP7 [Camellia lanceoleosa]|uniref:Transcription repressor OFP7 n=1 Tax=Camellia lanceoleosa TaxID=1840588 RepID=A0ACC0IWL8_9ERIC|nr:Transcription repressor OFP7 [Camellia lanceoleosa]
MAKGFKLRISRVISSFHFCCSKNPSNLPENPVASFLRLSLNPILVDFPPATPPPFKSHRSSFKRHVSSTFTSAGCGFGTQYTSEDGLTESPEFKWQKEDKWHVIAKVRGVSPRHKIYNSSVSGDSDNDLFPPPHMAAKKKRRSKKKKPTTRHRISTSSAKSGLFSDERHEEEEETETLVSSSRSFSTDSPRETPISRNHKKLKRAKRSVSKLIPSCAGEGKVKESFAVVKKSEDPFEDFKRSMMEMILEKQMFEERDLEQLLQCFLSLNSRHHHRVIVEAFADIWETLFCISSRISTHHHHGLSFNAFSSS